MKKTHSIAKAIEPVKPTQTVTLSEKQENELPDEALNLSPEQIMERASVKTALLNQILAQQEESHGWRHWGINE